MNDRPTTAHGVEGDRLPATAYVCTVQLDNYSPPRETTTAGLWRIAAEDSRNGSETFILDAPLWRDPERAVYIFDTGAEVIPLWVAGWQPRNGHVFLHRFPLSVGTRPDGRPIDMSGWMLGPRRAYHLKARSVGSTVY